MIFVVAYNCGVYSSFFSALVVRALLFRFKVVWKVPCRRRDDASRLNVLKRKVAERKARTGSTTEWTLAKLENMQYFLDKDNFLRYSTPLVVNKVALGSVLAVARNKIIRNAINRMTWKNIVVCAERMNVPAELLVDEDYYYNRCGLAGYRVVFEAARRGISLAELTDCPGQSDHPKYQYSWYALWYMFLKGSLNMQKYLNLQHLTTIIKLCNERLGMPVGALVCRTLHHDSGSTGVLGELADLLTALDDRECAFVAGVAKAVHDCKTGGLPVREQLSKLMEWYERGTS
jgi:hypothetical protein